MNQAGPRMTTIEPLVGSPWMMGVVCSSRRWKTEQDIGDERNVPLL